MNKLTGVAVLVSLVACSGVAFSIVEMQKMRTTIASLEDKIAKLEPAAGSTGAASNPVPAPGSAAAPADVQREIAMLKSEVAAVKSQQEALASAPSSGTNGSSTPKSGDPKAAPVSDEVKAAVEAVLAQKEAERKAADAKRQEEWAGRMAQGVVDNLAKELGLTEQQKTQVTEIIAAQTTAMRDMWNNRKEGDDLREKMGDVRKDTDTKIKAVLTPEQGVKYDELAKNPGQLFGGAFGGGGGGRRGGSRAGGSGDGN